MVQKWSARGNIVRRFETPVKSAAEMHYIIKLHGYHLLFNNCFMPLMPDLACQQGGALVPPLVVLARLALLGLATRRLQRRHAPLARLQLVEKTRSFTPKLRLKSSSFSHRHCYTRAIMLHMQLW